MKAYKLVDLDDAEVGMILWEPVLDGRGNVLLPAATELNDAKITSLRRRGIETVYVHNEEISEEELQKERARVQQRLEVLFRKCSASRACGILLQGITEYRLGEGK